MFIAKVYFVMTFLMNTVLKRLIVIILLCFQSACGSGDTSNENSSNNGTTPPISNHGNGIDVSKNFGSDPTVAAAVVDGHVNVYVAWEEPFGQQPSIVFRRSTDGGITFEPPRHFLFPVNPEGSHPVLAGVGKDVYLVWVGGSSQGNSEILFSISHNEGQLNPDISDSFTAPVRVSEIGRTSINPAIAVSQFNVVYISWLDQGDGAIYFRRSSNFGSDFDPVFDNQNQIRVLSEKQTAIDYPSIATGGSSVHVVWENLSNNPDGTELSDIFFRRSIEEGKTFFDSINLSSNLTNSQHPVIAADDQNVYIVWDDFSSTINSSSILLFQHSMDGGVSFDPPIQIPLLGTTTTGPRMAVDGNHIFIVWNNPAPNPNPDQEGSLQVFFARSDDQGNRFSIPFNISQNPTSAKNPAIAATNGQAYVVWEGQSGTGPDASQRIFFFRP